MTLWEEIEQQAPPGPRAAHSFDMLENRMVVFGGWNGKRALNDLHVFEFQSGSWQQCEVGQECPSARNNHATAVVDNKLFIHGGHDGSRWLSDMYVLTCNTSCQEDSVESRSYSESLTWSRAQTSGVHPAARACHTMSRVGRKIYLCGGYDGSSCFSSMEVLDLDTMTWIQPTVSGNVPIARNAHSMTVVGKQLYLFGGHSGTRHLNDLHVFDTTRFEWSTPNVTGSLPPGLRGHSANLVGNQIVVFGGYDGRNRANDLYVFDIIENKWSHPIPDTDAGAPPGRQRHSACLVGSKKLLIYAGFNGSKWLADLHLLDMGKFEEIALHGESNHQFVSNMAKLINNETFSDVKIHVEGRTIHAHRAILACQCDKFNALFASDMKESLDREIHVTDWPYDAYYALITYIYTGRLPDAAAGENNGKHMNKNPTSGHLPLDEILGIADAYTFDSLKTLCERILINSLELTNCCYLLKIGDQYNAKELKNNSLNFILKSFDQVVATDAFEQLSHSPQLLMEVTRAAATSSASIVRGGSGGF